jgi:phosphoglycerate dehydrogenase-like enzyme
MKIVFHFDGTEALRRRLEPLGVTLCPESDEDTFGRLLPEMDDLLARSDVVSLHLPLTPETQGILDAGKMKRGAILVNTARGGLVQGKSLQDCLESKHRGGAAQRE